MQTASSEREDANAPVRASVLPPAENRRGDDLRVNVHLRSRFQNMDQLVLAFTGDLSRGGMRLLSPVPIPIGGELDVTLALPDGCPEIVVRCRVTNASPGTEGQDHTLGVQFIDPGGEFLSRIEWYILNADPAAEQFGLHPHRRRLRLVVADDDPLQRQATAKPFIDRGDEVRLAADGLAALALCLQETPDVILTDVQMPKMDGWQFLRTLRGRPKLKTVPVLFLSTLASESDRLLGYRFGVDDYLHKPCPPANLVAQVDRAAIRAAQVPHAADPDVAQTALRGDLSMVSLASVLSFLELERRSGVVRIGPATHGVLYLCDGRLVDLEVDGLGLNATVEARFARILSERHGRFEFRDGKVDRPDCVNRSLGSLLLECARLEDERTR
jgi:two-component system OmpR family response regulator